MELQSFFRRIITPIALVLVVMAGSIYLYNATLYILKPPWHGLVVNVSAVLMFASIWLGALFSNTMAFFRGASFRERLLVCLFPACVWSAKVWLSAVGIYSWGELMFLLLHHIILGCPVVALVCMGISELWCRAIYRGRTGDRSVRILGFSNLSVLFIGVTLTLLMLWNGGHDYYYLYMDVYTYLFL